MRCAAENVLLSPREIEILALLRRGFKMCEVAEALDRSPYTVRSHVKAMYAGLNVSSAVELVMWSAEHPEALQGEWCHSPADFRPRSERVLRQGLADPVHKAA